MRPIRVAALALVVAVMSCSDATGPGREITKLEAARARWRAQNLHTYAFALQRSCECINTQPLYVAVLSDTVAGVLDFATGESLDRHAGATVDDLFDFIQSAIDHDAARIDVKFDALRGFPTEINYDGAAEAVDDEISYRVGDVHPISSPPRAVAP